MKFRYIIFCSIFAYTIISTTTPTTNKPINFRNLSVELVSDLRDLHKNVLHCLYQNGLNKTSFNDCVGECYIKVKDSYLDKYIGLKRQLVQLYTNKIDHACEDDVTPCNDIRNTLETNLQNNNDLFELLVDKRKELNGKIGVNRELLDYVIDDFRRDYGYIEDNKEKITKSLFSTVDQIKDYISGTGLAFDFDYKTFDPKDVYLRLGVEEKRSDNTFNSTLAKEASAKKLLNYYLANGMANVKSLDLTKLPSQVLEDIRKANAPVNM